MPLKTSKTRNAIVIDVAMPSFRAFRRTRSSAIRIRFALIRISVGTGGHADLHHRIAKPPATITIDEAGIKRGAFVRARSTAIVIRFVAVPNAIETRCFSANGISCGSFAFFARTILGNGARKTRRTTCGTNRSTIWTNFTAILHAIITSRRCANAHDTSLIRAIIAHEAEEAVGTGRTIRTAAINVCLGTVLRRVRTCRHRDANIVFA